MSYKKQPKFAMGQVVYQCRSFTNSNIHRSVEVWCPGSICGVRYDPECGGDPHYKYRINFDGQFVGDISEDLLQINKPTGSGEIIL